MNKEEAKLALEEGKKISHKGFLSHECISKVDGVMQDAYGNELNEADFWRYRNTPYFDNGWFIKE